MDNAVIEMKEPSERDSVFFGNELIPLMDRIRRLTGEGIKITLPMAGLSAGRE